MKKLLLLLALSFNAQADEVSAEYQKLGAEHGCSSGHYIAGSSYYGHIKDNSYYNNNSDYKNAWDIAFERCKYQQLELGRIITDSLMRW